MDLSLFNQVRPNEQSCNLSFPIFPKSPEEDCKSCLDKVGIALMHMSEDQVENIIELLSEQVCPIMPWDVDECKVGVATWWPKISEKIFDLAAAKYICGPDFIGVCPEPPTK